MDLLKICNWTPKEHISNAILIPSEQGCISIYSEQSWALQCIVMEKLLIEIHKSMWIFLCLFVPCVVSIWKNNTNMLWTVCSDWAALIELILRTLWIVIISSIFSAKWHSSGAIIWFHDPTIYLLLCLEQWDIQLCYIFFYGYIIEVLCNTYTGIYSA